MSRLIIALAISVSSSAFAATNIACETTVKGSSGSGQKFVFINHLYLNFQSDDSASAKFYSQPQGASNQLEDAGTLDKKGADMAEHPDYIVYSGADHVESGSISFALPQNALKLPAGTHFHGYFQTLETDTGAKPIPFNTAMECTIK